MDVSELAAQIRTLPDLDKVVIVNKAGRPAIRLRWTAALFFDGGETADRRRQANGVLRDFVTAFPGRLTHYHPEDSERLKTVGGLDLLAYHDDVAEKASAQSGRNENDMYSADVYGFDEAKEVMEPAPFYVGVVGASREGRQASYVIVNIPLTWPAHEGYAAASATFKRWCDILKPSHGTMSPAIVLMQGGGRNELVSAYPLLKRFPGLDFVDASRWSVASRKDQRKIRTVGWLTVIDDGFVASLGGLEALRDRIGSEQVSFAPFSGGVVIQAGESPQLGDRNRGEAPAAYRSVAQTLAPLVFDAFPRGIFYPIPANLDPIEETRAWLRRFD